LFLDTRILPNQRGFLNFFDLKISINSGIGVQEANTLLPEKDRIKSEYVLLVSHDIKESLAAIQSCIEPVTDTIVGSLNATQADLHSTARDRTGKLVFFVRALLEITKIKLTKKVTMEYVSFPDLIGSISKDIFEQTQNKGLRFTTDVSPVIHEIEGIRIYVEEAISNLLVNSVKYTPEGGDVRLLAEDKGDTVRITIRGTGIGIPRDEVLHIFEEFFRAKNVKQIEVQGTGLGLSIAKEIVEMHKGRIWFESKENKGTSFYIELPKRQEKDT